MNLISHGVDGERRCPWYGLQDLRQELKLGQGSRGNKVWGKGIQMDLGNGCDTHAGPYITHRCPPQSIHSCRGTKNQAQQMTASLYSHQLQCSHSRPWMEWPRWLRWRLCLSPTGGLPLSKADPAMATTKHPAHYEQKSTRPLQCTML